MDQVKIVDYCKFCNKCKHYELKGTDEPCEECLLSPVNTNSKKPIKFEEGNTMDLENVTEEVNEAMNKKVDPTNPDHYKNSTSLECIEAMEIIFGINAVIDFCVCNAWKYIWRWKNKNGVEDLDKAKWYIDRAQTLMYDNFAVAARKRYADIILRMSDYIDEVERNQKNED